MASLFENEKEALTAMSSGTDFIQGFYLAKPQKRQQLDSNLAKTSLNNSLFHVIVKVKSLKPYKILSVITHWKLMVMKKAQQKTVVTLRKLTQLKAQQRVTS
jgi:c-di-GMP-related signal transduction protein